MADVATPPAAQASTNGAAAPPAKQQVVKPDKPDEDKYKEELAKLEKEHAAAQEKLVSTCPVPVWCAQSHGHELTGGCIAHHHSIRENY